MPIIHKISVQKNNQHRYNVFFEKGSQEEYAFSVSEDILIKHQLRKGLELSELQIEKIQYDEHIQKAYSRALNYLSYRMRSEKEVRDDLKEKEYSAGVINEVIIRLKEKKYLNDKEYAKAFVQTQINTTDKGPIVIRNVLKEKGIKESAIEEVLQLFSFDEQLEKAYQLSTKFLKKKKGISSFQLKAELQLYLRRKGFPGDIIQQATEIALADSRTEQDIEAIKVQGEKAWRKFSKEPEDKKILKVKQALFRKGFSIDIIDQFLAEKENEGGEEDE